MSLWIKHKTISLSKPTFIIFARALGSLCASFSAPGGLKAICRKKVVKINKKIKVGNIGKVVSASPFPII